MLILLFTITGPLHAVPFTDIGFHTCDERGATLSIDDIEVTIPPRAIPCGVTVHLVMGVALYGPFNFSENHQPVSPILWFCILEDIELLLPIKFKLPHVVADISRVQLSFAKTNHLEYDSARKEELFSFKTFSGGESNFTNPTEKSGYGYLSTKHLCFLCIEANTNLDLTLEKCYCLHILIEENDLKYYRTVLVCTYFLETCFKVR